MTDTTTPATATPSRRLAGRLGPGSIVFMVVAAAAPLTVVAGTVPIGIAAGNGASYPATYVVCTAVLLLFSVGFTAMSRHVSDAGAFYSYVARGLGRRAGVGTAFLALASYAAVQLAVVGFIGASIDVLLVDHGGPDLPWWVWSLVCLAITGLLGYRHIEFSGRVLGVLLVAEVVVVLVISLAVVGKGGGPEGLATTSFSPSGFFDGAPGIAMIFAIAGYIGFEATAIFRDEARDPERTIPRATYGALLLIGGFYAFSSWAIVSAWGDEGAVARAAADPGTMVGATAVEFLGSAAGDVVQVLLVTSLFAALLSFHNVIARYVFSLGRSGVLPAACGRSHATHLSPHVASVVTSVTATVLMAVCVVAGLDPVLQVFTWFAGVAAVGILALMLLTSVAVLAYFRGRPGLVGPWASTVAPALGGLGLAVLLFMTAANLDLLVGGSVTLAAVLGAALVACFVAGFVLATARPHIAPTTPDQPDQNRNDQTRELS